METTKDIQAIDNIELVFLNQEDYADIRNAMIESYSNMPTEYWHENHIKTLINKFPEGQVAIKVNNELAGCALSIIVDYRNFDNKHTYSEITGAYTFSTHTISGDILYGIDVFIRSKYRGLRLGRRLYDYRKELCERLNLKGIVFGGRIPNYHKYSDKITAREYIDKVRGKEIVDPVLNFQISNDFHPSRIMQGYLEGDKESKEYAVLLKWDNVYYEKNSTKAAKDKTIVRLGLIQWQMRLYKNLDELMQQAEYFVDAVSGYRSYFALFPELFNAPLMSEYNHLSEPEAIRKLAENTAEIVNRFSELAITYNINIITGSMPEIVENKLYNVGYLCKRDGGIDRFEKLHVTPDETKVWGLNGGDQIKTFDTDCGKIGILICYDIEFPELGRLLADEGMNILFVPYLTDTQNGFSRVRNCAQARAIENECYVAIAGSVGNLPKVHNMDIQYAQAMVFTPCDFSFPTNGIKAEATPNTEMILIADVDIDMLRELNQFGNVRNLRDRRTDIYSVVKKTGKRE
ncbi:MAG: bifunctional GNAT family N-acetyltransferase/carbon-nitrogen hydrolase family protein [Bacteroidales bacterium]|nr:bifunctional GNAT family N-acetyltransferase/carbon-nitrogen hydrolase family protein [Bacteroidales bacterium]